MRVKPLFDRLDVPLTPYEMVRDASEPVLTGLGE